MNKIISKHHVKRFFTYALVLLMVLTSYQPVNMSYAVEGVGFSISPEYINTDQLPTVVTVTADTSAFTVGSAYPTLINTETEETQSVSIVDSTATTMKFTVPAGVDAGTYEIRISDPEGDQGDSTKYYSATTTYAVGASSVTTDVPFVSLPKAYDEQESVTVTGEYTSFSVGQTTVELLQSSSVIDSASVTAVADGDGSTQTITFTVGTGLSSGTYDVRFTTGDDVDTVTGGVVVRGTPSIALDTSSVTEGYSITNISVTGANTGFDDSSSVQILDSEGDATGKAGSANVTDDETLGFQVSPGLSAGTYTVRVTTGVEVSNATFTVYAPSAELKKQSDSSSISSIGQYFSSQSLKLIGTNTSFESGETTLAVFQNSSELEGAITGTPTVNSSTEILFTLAGWNDWTTAPAVGDVEIIATTGGEQATATLTVVEPSLDLSYNSDAVVDDIIANGYKEFDIDIVGTNTFFSASSTVSVDSVEASKTFTDSKNLAFTLTTGLAEGTHTVTIDLDGTNSLTTSIEVGPAASITSVSPNNVLRTKNTVKTYTVYGSDTHFTAGTPSIDIVGADSESIQDVTVIDATTLTFGLTPSTVDVNGTLDLSVTVNSDAISETATLTDALTASNQGIEASPETYYTLERGNATVAVAAEGFTYDSSVGNISVTVGGNAVSSITRDSDTQISFDLPSGVSTGSQTISVDNNGTSYTTSISVVTSQEDSNTPAYKIYGYGHNSDGNIVVQGNDTLEFDSSYSPVVVATRNSVDYSMSVASISDSNNTLTMTLPDGLSAGYYTITLTWSSGPYSGNTLTISNYEVKNELDGSDGIQIYYSGIEASDRTVYLNGSGTVVFTAIGDVINGSASSDKTANATWASSDESVATISAGTATVVGRGNTTLSVAYDDATDEITLYVNGPDSIDVSGSDANVRIGETVTLTAVATYGDSTTETITGTAVWSASNSNVSVSDNVVTGVKSGQTTVSAAYGGATGTLALTVSSIDFTPSTVRSLELGNVSVIIDGIETGTTITSLTVGGTSVTPTDDGSDISFVPPVGTSIGNVAVDVVAGGQTHSATLAVAESSMSLSTVLLEEGYEAFDMVATLKNAEVLAAEEPEVTFNGSILSPADVTVDESADTITFPVEAGLTAETYDVVVEWTSGDYIGNSLTESMTIAAEGSVEISLTGTSTISVNDTSELSLVATVDGVEQTLSGEITWSSSDESVATVNDGVVTAIASGSATITATFQNEDYTILIVVPATSTPSTGDDDDDDGGGGGSGSSGGPGVVLGDDGTGTPDPGTVEKYGGQLDKEASEGDPDAVNDGFEIFVGNSVILIKTNELDLDKAEEALDTAFSINDKFAERADVDAGDLAEASRNMSFLVGAYVSREDVSAADAVVWADKVIDQVGSETLLKAGQTSQAATSVATDVIENVLVKVLDKGIDEDTATAVFETFMQNVAKTALRIDTAKVDSAKLMNRIVKATEDIIEIAGKVDQSKFVQTQVGAETTLSVDANALVLAANNAIQKKEELRIMVALNTATDVQDQLTARIGLDLPETEGDVKLDLDPDAVSGVQGTGAEIQVSAKGAKFVFSNETLNEMKGSGIKLEVGDVGSLEQTLYLKDMSMAMRQNIAKVDNTKQISVEGYDDLVNKPTLSLDFDDTVIFVPERVNVFVYDEDTAQWEFVNSDVDQARASVSFKPPHFSVYSVVEYSRSFDDVKEHWSKDFVEAMASRGLTSGISETMFGPDYSITRAQFATLLANALGLEGEAGSAFNDVKQGTWYFDTVNLAYQAGLVSGMGNGMFEPDAQITREQMAVMIAKAYQIMLGTEMKGLEAAITDMTDVSPWAMDAVKAVSYHGVVSGYEDGSFKPDQYATRAHGIVMLKKLLDLK